MRTAPIRTRRLASSSGQRARQSRRRRKAYPSQAIIDIRTAQSTQSSRARWKSSHPSHVGQALVARGCLLCARHVSSTCLTPPVPHNLPYILARFTILLHHQRGHDTPKAYPKARACTAARTKAQQRGYLDCDRTHQAHASFHRLAPKRPHPASSHTPGTSLAKLHMSHLRRVLPDENKSIGSVFIFPNLHASRGPNHLDANHVSKRRVRHQRGCNGRCDAFGHARHAKTRPKRKTRRRDW